MNRRSVKFEKEVYEYIEKYRKEKKINATKAINEIIKEHKKTSKKKMEEMSEYIIKRFDEKYKNLLTRLRLGVNYTDRNVQVIIEVLNTILIEKDINIVIPTNINKSMVIESLEKNVKVKIEKYKQKKDDKRKK